MHHSFVRTSKKPCILVSVYIVHHENSHVKQWPQNLPALNARSIHDPRTQASHSMYLVFTTHGLLASPTEVIFSPYISATDLSLDLKPNLSLSYTASFPEGSSQDNTVKGTPFYYSQTCFSSIWNVLAPQSLGQEKRLYEGLELEFKDLVTPNCKGTRKSYLPTCPKGEEYQIWVSAEFSPTAALKHLDEERWRKPQQ